MRLANIVLGPDGALTAVFWANPEKAPPDYTQAKASAVVPANASPTQVAATLRRLATVVEGLPNAEQAFNPPKVPA